MAQEYPQDEFAGLSRMEEGVATMATTYPQGSRFVGLAAPPSLFGQFGFRVFDPRPGSAVGAQPC